MGEYNLVGERFGRLTVVEKAGKANSHGVLWKCVCDCGKTTVTRSRYLRGGSTRSCGCLRAEQKSAWMSKSAQWNTKHGMAKRGRIANLYTRWESMRNRCYNPSNIMYHRYGGRGIRVCDEWEEFEPFKEWAIANGFNKGLALDRVDGNGDYCPGNCRWVTQKENNRNKSNLVYLTIDGERHLLVDWAEMTGQPRARLYYRKKNGWTDEEVVYGRNTVNCIKTKRGV